MLPLLEVAEAVVPKTLLPALASEDDPAKMLLPKPVVVDDVPVKRLLPVPVLDEDVPAKIVFPVPVLAEDVFAKRLLPVPVDDVPPKMLFPVLVNANVLPKRLLVELPTDVSLVSACVDSKPEDDEKVDGTEDDPNLKTGVSVDIVVVFVAVAPPLLLVAKAEVELLKLFWFEEAFEKRGAAAEEIEDELAATDPLFRPDKLLADIPKENGPALVDVDGAEDDVSDSLEKTPPFETVSSSAPDSGTFSTESEAPAAAEVNLQKNDKVYK